MSRSPFEVETAVAEGRAAVENVAGDDAPTAEAGGVVSGEAACANCGERLAGDYCHRCGEKRPEARDLSVRHFVGEAARELTSLDSKLYHTIVALLFRPGRLTNEWVRGRRVRYIKPLNLCLGVLAASLFVMTASKQANVFDIRFIISNEREIMKSMVSDPAEWEKRFPEGGVYAHIFARAAARKGVPAESLYDAVNEKWQRNLSLLQPALIVLLALLLQLVYVFARRFFVEHLVFSMHFLSFAVLSNALMYPLYYFTGIHLSRWMMSVTVLKFLVDILYLFLALRAVYRGHPALVVLGALFVFAGYVLIYGATFMVALFTAMNSVLR